MKNLLFFSFRFVIAVLILLSYQFSFAEDSSEVEKSTPRKTIGLVLSGGGARGLAHIGVLRWLEEHRIPVDYVAGTSMGGLVGGMYAMGMSPEEMAAYIRTINWQRAFGTGSNYDQLSFRRKQDRRQYRTDLEFGLRKGLKLPSGLSNGHYIGLRIDRITLPYSTIPDFDALPIPFRCVATDIVNAEEVILKDGSLSRALRATMSLPAIFSPVELNGRILVDGGVLNNIPTDVMKEMGAELIVAVNIGTPLGDRDSVASWTGVLGQTIGVMMAGNERRNFELADVKLKPELEGITTLDFSKMDEVIQHGYEGAQEKEGELVPYAMSEEEWNAYLAQRTARKKETIPIPGEVDVTGVSDIAAENIELKLEHLAGKEIDPDVVEDSLTRLVGEGRYESLNYQMAESEVGDVLEIQVREKKFAPPTLIAAFEIQGSDINDFNFSVGARVTLFDVLKYGSEWRNDLKIGFDSFIGTEYFYPIGYKGFFFAPLANYGRTRQSLFDPQAGRLAEYNVNLYNLGGDFGFITWQNEFRLGYILGRDAAELRSGAADQPDVSGKFDYVRFRWSMDSANSATLPTNGERIIAEARYYFSAAETEENFPQLEIRPFKAFPVSPKGTVFATGLFGTTFDRDAGPFQQFAVGGPFQLGAFDEGEFRGNHAVQYTVGYYHQIYELPPLIGGKVWLGAWYAAGDAFNDFGDMNLNHQGAIGFLVDTKIGPFALVGALGEDGKGNVYFTFGKLF